MGKYLVKTVETYRVANEQEAKSLIEEAKASKDYVLTKYLSEKKEVKKKGEIEDEWVRVTLTKAFNDEKMPDSSFDISYNKEFGAFPSPINRDEEEDEE